MTPFVFYTFRHACITRRAKHIDPFTLHVLAGHADMNTTKRCVHPSDAGILEAMWRVHAITSEASALTASQGRSLADFLITIKTRKATTRGPTVQAKWEDVGTKVGTV